jgi:hypothetical protein
MSIQDAKNKSNIRRVFHKLNLMIWLDKFSEFRQKYHRNKKKSTSCKVFFPYITHHSHPYIKERWYGQNSPVLWSNYEESELIHAIGLPPKLVNNKSVIIEPMDQILTLSSYFGANTPSECLTKIPDVINLLNDNRVKGILVGSDELVDQYKFYFGNNAIQKLIVYPQMRCLPKYTKDTLKNKLDKEKGQIIFLFLASSFKIKAVEIVIKSWKLSIPENSKLIIVCNDIPNSILDDLKLETTISIINKAPLNPILKRELLVQSSVTLSFTHIDAGANSWEGIEYGHAIITNDFQRGNYMISNKNGIIIPFKNKFYEPGRYGIEWDSLDEYMNVVQADFEKGLYEGSIEKLSAAFILLSERKDILTEMRLRSIELAWSQSVQNSNQKLLKVYTNALDSV